MRGRWAAGIVPRNFCWIIKDHLAVSERPGGYAPNHRKVRRHEELLWLRAQGFTRVVSLLASTHNLHAYDELRLEWSRFAMPAASDTRDVLAELYPALHGWLRNGERVLLHQEELGDCVMGVVAGYLLWSEILPDGPREAEGKAASPEDAGAGEPGDGDTGAEGRTASREGRAEEAGEGATASPESQAAGDTEQGAAPLTEGLGEGEVGPVRADQGERPGPGPRR